MQATTVEHKGKTLTLQQEAFASGTNDDQFYEAHALDADGNDYMVRWEIMDYETEDEEACCDWGIFTVRSL